MPRDDLKEPMTKPFRLDYLAIDPVEYASHGNAILGIRGSGKSYTATYIAERLFDAGIPFIAFDPIGVWRNLRLPGAGKGYPVVVAGGKSGDLPLSVAGAPAIVRAAMQGGVSLVIDLFDINLSKADWRRIVTASVRTLLHENHDHGLRHLFIEEAAEFCPQRPIDFDVYAEIEKLARMGGNARLGYTLINQRSQEVSKAVLELCENVFLHRQRGKNALENMDKWLQVAGATEKKIMQTLPDLPQGQCWAWLGGDTPQPPSLVTVPRKNSAHPDRRVVRSDAGAITAKPVDVAAFVDGMRGQLDRIVEEAKANDPKALKARIAELERQLAGKVATMPGEEVLRLEYERGRRDGARAQHPASHHAGWIDGKEGAMKAASALVYPGAPHAKPLMLAGDAAPTPQASAQHRQEPFVMVGQSNRVAVKPPGPLPYPPPAAKGADGLGKGDRLVLTVLAQYRPARVSASKAAAISGYSVRSSTWRNILSRLRQAGSIEEGPEPYAITAAGLSALGAFDPLPTGPALLEHWMARVGKGDRETLRILATLRGECASSDLAQRAGYSPSSSTWRNILSRLRTLGLIEGSRNIKLHEDLR